MSASSVSSVSNVSAANAHALVKAVNGEYTASSVNANPALAAGLVELKDGNYSYPIVSPADRFQSVLTNVDLPVPKNSPV